MTAQRKAGFSAPWVSRASADEISAAQALRAELDATAGLAMTVSVACGEPPATSEGMQEWAVARADGELLRFGRVRYFGEHHTLTVAIDAAVKEARSRAADGLTPRLTVLTHDRGFGPVNLTGSVRDNGRGGKTRRVAERALRAGVLLRVEWVPHDEPLAADAVKNAWSCVDAEHHRWLAAERAEARRGIAAAAEREIDDRLRRGELPI